MTEMTKSIDETDQRLALQGTTSHLRIRRPLNQWMIRVRHAGKVHENGSAQCGS